MASELITLTTAPNDEVLAALVDPNELDEVQTHIRRGQDAAGNRRVQITLIHADVEVIAQARQQILQRCRAAKIRAFVV